MRKIVSAIILVKGKNLLVREKGEVHYKNVGGGVDEGETEEAALRREFKEELSGAEIKSFSYSHEQTRTTKSGTYDVRYYEVSIDGTPAPGRDTEEVRFFDPAFAKSRDYYIRPEDIPQSA